MYSCVLGSSCSFCMLSHAELWVSPTNMLIVKREVFMLEQLRGLRPTFDASSLRMENGLTRLCVVLQDVYHERERRGSY